MDQSKWFDQFDLVYQVNFFKQESIQGGVNVKFSALFRLEKPAFFNYIDGYTF